MLEDESVDYLVFDPITGDRQSVPDPSMDLLSYTAAVFCTADGCDHLDCHSGPFLVVFMATLKFEDNIFATVYSSEKGSWSVPVSFDNGCEAYVQHMRDGPLRPTYTPYVQPRRGTVVGDAIYFTIQWGNAIVKYEWGKNCLSMINPPSPKVYYIALMAMENSSLGLACIQGSSLYTWSRKVDSGATEWVQGRVIELETIIPVVSPDQKLFMVGSAEGVGVIFISTDAGLFSIELKSGRVRKVDKPGVYFSVLPYMSFYTPEGVGVIFISTDVGLFTIEIKSRRVRKVDKPGVYNSVLPYMRFYTPDHGRLLSLTKLTDVRCAAQEEDFAKLMNLAS